MRQPEKIKMAYDSEGGGAWSIHGYSSGPAGSATALLSPNLQASFDVVEPEKLVHIFTAETNSKEQTHIDRAIVGLLVGHTAVEVMIDPESYLDDDGWAEVHLEGSSYARKIAGRLSLLRVIQEEDEEKNGLNRAWSLEAAYLLNELSVRVPQSEFLRRSAEAEAVVAIDWLRDLGMEKTVALHAYSESLFAPVSKLVFTALSLAVGEREPEERKNPPMFLFDFDIKDAEKQRERLEKDWDRDE